MKHLFFIAILSSLALSSFGQKTKTLSAETPVRKSVAVANMYPKITLNNHKCKFERLSVKPVKGEMYRLHFGFARPCDGEDGVSLMFDNLAEAILVKDLVLTNEDYEVFHLVKGKSNESTFEIIYAKD